jgi:hypothetical protein
MRKKPLCHSEPRLCIIIACMALLSIAACGSQDDGSGEPTPEPVATSSDPLLSRLFVEQEEELGHIKDIAADDTFAKRVGARAHAFGKKHARTGLVKIYADGRVSATAYDETVAEAVAARSARRTADGSLIAEAGPDRGEPEEVLVDKSLSGGVDNRIYLGSPTYNFFDRAFSRIGTVSGAPPEHHCTGTLIGARLVFTAGHCVGVTSQGALIGTGYFTPQQHGASGTPPGWSSYAPWGTAAFDIVYLAPWWLSLGCYANPLAPNCWKYDFAVAVLKPNQFTGPMGHPGYTAIAMFNEATTRTLSLRNVGYPACSPNSPPEQVPPANCQAHQPYGDVVGCGGLTPTFSGASASYGWPWSPTFNPAVQTGCDVSVAHSGGPLYTYTSPCGSPGPCVFGNVHSGAGYPYGSTGVRINTTLFNYLVNLRSLYP